MGKNEIYWAMFENEILVHTSIRRSENKCRRDFYENLKVIIDEENNNESCRKIIINEFKETK